MTVTFPREAAMPLAFQLAQFVSDIPRSDPRSRLEVPMMALDNPHAQVDASDGSKLAITLKSEGLRPVILHLSGPDAYNLCADLSEIIPKMPGYPWLSD